MARPRDFSALNSPDLFSERSAATERPWSPTAEQIAVVEASDVPSHLAVNAFAGASKTSTLILVAERQRARRRKGLYLAFNKAIAVEAASKFGANAVCKTTHALAYASIARMYGGDAAKMTGGMSPHAIVTWLSLPKFGAASGVSDRHLAAAIKETLASFCYSADPDINAEHIYWPRAADRWDAGRASAYAAEVLRLTKQLWSYATDPYSGVPLGHDGYLKKWSMSSPRVAADFVMLDEAQDSNPVLLHALSLVKTPVVYVGDRHQQIYGFRRAVNAMASVPLERTRHLTRSFRFGANIAALATRVLALLDEPRSVVGAGKPGTVVIEFDRQPVATPYTTLTRTNAMLIGELFAADRAGLLTHVIGGTQELANLLDAAEMLQAGVSPATGPLFGFANWAEVVEYVKEFGGELKPFVTIVSDHGVPVLRALLARVSPQEDGAQAVLSTGHKSKGREWERVRLAPDFRVQRQTLDGDFVKETSEELRLFYVALTRAKSELRLPSALDRELREVELME